MAQPRRVAVIGGGWAGLATAIEATRRGASVTLFEMAPQLGGRARTVAVDGLALDNGQHICIGAYTETLRLLHELGVSERDAFVRTPLRLVDANGNGLLLGNGPAVPAFGLAVLRRRGWRLGEKLALLRAAARWRASGFRCALTLTVAELTRELPPTIRSGLIDPLCVAALNTPSEAASASVFLRVLGDALFGGRGAADLLLPRIGLGDVLPQPAANWLALAHAEVRLRHRVEALIPDGDRWRVDGVTFDAVVLAASASESARLAQPVAPTWSGVAAALRYAPIVTVYLRAADTVLPEPMLALQSDTVAPAQFVFDRGRLGGPKGLLAFVISGAERWVDAGTPATVSAIRRQAETALGPLLRGALETLQVFTERRATFRCTPELQRPPMAIAPRLCAAGDHVDGPYPSTLEGAIRSGTAAARSLLRDSTTDRAGFAR
ncbi:MAG: hydroxysqualene dehydroxylase HpnE [Caldimonas sp.]